MEKTNNQTPQNAVIKRRIGTTTFTINVHFSDTAKESIEDKMLRLIKNDIAKSA